MKNILSVLIIFASTHVFAEEFKPFDLSSLGGRRFECQDADIKIENIKKSEEAVRKKQIEMCDMIPQGQKKTEHQIFDDRSICNYKTYQSFDFKPYYNGAGDIFTVDISFYNDSNKVTFRTSSLETVADVKASARGGLQLTSIFHSTYFIDVRDLQINADQLLSTTTFSAIYSSIYEPREKADTAESHTIRSYKLDCHWIH